MWCMSTSANMTIGKAQDEHQLKNNCAHQRRPRYAHHQAQGNMGWRVMVSRSPNIKY
jgi:hypothetical protein